MMTAVCMVTAFLAMWNTNSTDLIRIFLLELHRQHMHFVFTSIPHPFYVTSWICFLINTYESNIYRI